VKPLSIISEEPWIRNYGKVIVVGRHYVRYMRKQQKMTTILLPLRPKNNQQTKLSKETVCRNFFALFTKWKRRS